MLGAVGRDADRLGIVDGQNDAVYLRRSGPWFSCWLRAIRPCPQHSGWSQYFTEMSSTDRKSLRLRPDGR